MMRRAAFTLMEVLVSVAVAGLVITAGFRLIAMSYRLLGEVSSERRLISAAHEIWFRFRTDKDMPDSGTDSERGISWKAGAVSLEIDGYELKYRKVTVTIAENRSAVIYVP